MLLAGKRLPLWPYVCLCALVALPSCSAKRSIALDAERAHASSEAIRAIAARGDAALEALQPSLDEDQAPLVLTARGAFENITEEATTVSEATHEISEALPGVKNVGLGLFGWATRIGGSLLAIALLIALVVAFGPSLVTLGVPGITWFLKRLWSTGKAIPRSIHKAVDEARREFDEGLKSASPDERIRILDNIESKRKHPAFDAAWRLAQAQTSTQ